MDKSEPDAEISQVTAAAATFVFAHNNSDVEGRKDKHTTTLKIDHAVFL